MHLIYGIVNGKSKTALRMYQKHFPSRRMPYHKMFQRLHRQLCKNGLFIAITDGRVDQGLFDENSGRNHLGPCGRSIRHKYKGCSMPSTCQSTNHLENFTVGLVMEANSKTVLTISVQNHSFSILLLNVLCFR
ncbi:hypothetical protein TNCV_4704871 [Trichonephila clavipes]|nr:hypothetical protein TNCV_4704871 [Trichonephila clavipes]